MLRSVLILSLYSWMRDIGCKKGGEEEAGKDQGKEDAYLGQKMICTLVSSCALDLVICCTYMFPSLKHPDSSI